MSEQSLHERWRQAALRRWSRLVSRRPGAVLIVALALALLGAGYAAMSLRFESSRNALLADDLPWNQRFIAWRGAFAGESDLYVIVDTRDAAGRASEAAQARAERMVSELAVALARLDAVRDVFWGFDRDDMHPRTMQLQPLDELRAALARMRAAEVVLGSETPAALLEQAMRGAEAASASIEGGGRERAEQVEAFADLIDAFTRRLGVEADQPVDLAALVDGERVAPRATANAAARGGGGDGGGGWRYLRTPNRRFVLIRVVPKENGAAINPAHEAIAAVRAVVDVHRAQHPDVSLGLTGLGAIEHDETAAAMRDSMRASVAAVVLIGTLLVVGFHSFRVPLLLLASLLIGIAWSFGFITLAVGHLQVISVVVTVVLLGLGVAFGIHLASRLELVRHAYADTEDGFADALADTLESTGPGMLTGALTTAAAFATTLLTDFRGVAEMGLIAAAGILLCLLAMCSVFPALLRLLRPGHHHVRRMTARRVHVFDERWVMPFVRRPRATLVVAGLVVLASLGAITQMRFDYNLLALLPRGVESVTWQQRIVEEGELSVYSGVSVVGSMDEARALARRYRALPDVAVEGGLGGVGMLIPRDEARKQAAIVETRQALEPGLAAALAVEAWGARGAGTPSPGPSLKGPEGEDDLLTRAGAMRVALRWGAGRMPEELRPALGRLEASLAELVSTGHALPAAEREARLAALRADYARYRSEMARQIDAALDPSPVRVEDLPAELLRPYVGRGPDGRPLLALEVYPALPAGIGDPLQPAFLGGFVEQLRTVDDEVTGTLVQLYESGQLIWRSYLLAGGIALLAVFVLVWLDFRRLSDAALTLVPVAAGFAATFGVMYLVGARINPANIIVLPLIFGIGVDAGVHVMHRYRQSPLADPPGLAAGTGKGVTLTSLTTIIGFAVLLGASHRGMASLGFVLSTGIALTLLACWMIMPAYLALRRGREARAVG